MSMVVKNQFVLWLQRYDWTWFCTLTFRPGIRRKASDQILRHWMLALEAYEGHNLSWLRMVEHGGVAGKLHFHVLIAGVQRTPTHRAVDLWIKMAGAAVIGPYDPERRGLQYALKSIEDDPDYDFDAALFGEHIRRRAPRPRTR
jgi:hypothetical protein